MQRKYSNTRTTKTKQISAEKQWKWRLAENEHNKRTAETLIVVDNERQKRTSETLIVNTPSEGSIVTYPLLLLLLLLLLFLFLFMFLLLLLLMLLLLLIMFIFLCCCCIYCFKVSVEQKWNWRLAENGWNRRTVEALIINTPSGDQTALTLWFCCCCCSLFFAVTAEIVSIKTVPRNF